MGSTDFERFRPGCNLGGLGRRDGSGNRALRSAEPVNPYCDLYVCYVARCLDFLHLCICVCD